MTRDKWWTPLLATIVVTVTAGILQQLIAQVGGDFAKNNLSVVGDYIDWRWSTLTTLSVVFVVSFAAYSVTTKDAFSRLGGTFEPAEGGQVATMSDGIYWVYTGWLSWPSGRRELELSEECPQHRIPLLHWNQSQKRPEAIDRAYGQVRFRGLYCSGTDEASWHIVTLTESKTLDVARRKAAVRLRALIAAQPPMGVERPGSSSIEFWQERQSVQWYVDQLILAGRSSVLWNTGSVLRDYKVLEQHANKIERMILPFPAGAAFELLASAADDYFPELATKIKAVADEALSRGIDVRFNIGLPTNLLTVCDQWVMVECFLPHLPAGERPTYRVWKELNPQVYERLRSVYDRLWKEAHPDQPKGDQ